MAEGNNAPRRRHFIISEGIREFLASNINAHQKCSTNANSRLKLLKHIVTTKTQGESPSCTVSLGKMRVSQHLKTNEFSFGSSRTRSRPRSSWRRWNESVLKTKNSWSSSLTLSPSRSWRSGSACGSCASSASASSTSTSPTAASAASSRLLRLLTGSTKIGQMRGPFPRQHRSPATGLEI